MFQFSSSLHFLNLVCLNLSLFNFPRIFISVLLVLAFLIYSFFDFSETVLNLFSFHFLSFFLLFSHFSPTSFLFLFSLLFWPRRGEPSSHAASKNRVSITKGVLPVEVLGSSCFPVFGLPFSFFPFVSVRVFLISSTFFFHLNKCCLLLFLV